MAARLTANGHTVAVWNRSRKRAEPLVAQGARLAATPRDAAQGADAVVAMVADDPHHAQSGWGRMARSTARLAEPS